jgi:hypothetical protein
MRKRDPYARWLEPTSNMSVWSPMHDRIRQDFGHRMFFPLRHRMPGSSPWGCAPVHGVFRAVLRSSGMSHRAWNEVWT